MNHMGASPTFKEQCDQPCFSVDKKLFLAWPDFDTIFMENMEVTNHHIATMHQMSPELLTFLGDAGAKADKHTHWGFFC